MLGSIYTWTTLALIVVIGLIVWKGKGPIIGGLDRRAERIRSELDEAQNLREEAQHTLEEYKRRQREAADEAKAIIDHAKEEAVRLRRKAEGELAESLARREQQAMDKIAQAEAEALAEVRSRAVDVAVAAAGRLIADNLDEAKSSEVMGRSIEEVKAKLN